MLNPIALDRPRVPARDLQPGRAPVANTGSRAARRDHTILPADAGFWYYAWHLGRRGLGIAAAVRRSPSRLRTGRGQLRRGALTCRAAIESRDVSKRFRLYHERYSSLKERVIHFGRHPVRRLLGAARRRPRDRGGHDRRSPRRTTARASRRCSSASPGSCGRPTGEIRCAGRIAALLELGAGFHPELTGRENIYLNGSILGMSQARDRPAVRRDRRLRRAREVHRQAGAHYSSGMYVRLGFAVAVNVDPDILLVDEVLAVGDEAFQRKCLDRIQRVPARGPHDRVRDPRAPISCARSATAPPCSTTGQLVADGHARARRSARYREQLLDARREREATSRGGGTSTPTTTTSSQFLTDQERRRTLDIRITDVAGRAPRRRRPGLPPARRRRSTSASSSSRSSPPTT